MNTSTVTMKVAALFCDHMILQCGIAVPVWGWAAAGDTNPVRFAGQATSTRPGRDGRWKVLLTAWAASHEPREMVVSSRVEKRDIRISDVIVGEVWICSGQSNMEWTLASAKNAAEETAAAEYPAIRLFSVPRKASGTVADDVEANWSRCAPGMADSFSAVGYFFGRELHRKTGTPIGLINSSWGGTIAEAWTSRRALESVPTFRKMLREYELEVQQPDDNRAKQEEWVLHNDRKDTVNAGAQNGWQLPETPDGDWDVMDLPRSWQSAGHEYSGIFWFRHEVEIPVAWDGCDLTLSLGPTDKSDITYFNGVQVGSITMAQRGDAWCTPRIYTVPASLVKAGRAVIAVRVFSNIYSGGFIGAPGQMSLQPVVNNNWQPIALSGNWRFRVEANFGLVVPPPPPLRGPGNPNTPHILFDSMIHPLVPYAIRGAIWYQGESNADKAKQYRTLFPLMIRSWREAWKQGKRAGSPEREFPFLFVQLANFMLPSPQPEPCAWAELREAQAMTLSMPNTGMAVAIDIGETADIHPRNKQDVGYRLALPALANVYGFKGLVMSGPQYKSMSREKGLVRLAFDHVAGGLIVNGGKLEGFAIAGNDRKFVWAEAVIDGDRVVVSSPQVPKPVAVRYGWANNPPSSLYNASNLPASPFRTDTWPGITA